MNKFITKVLFPMCALSLSSAAMAEDDDKGEKIHQIGLASYAIDVVVDNYTNDPYAYDGGAIFYTGAISDSLALRLGAYGVVYDKNSDESITGTEVSLLIGSGLRSEGFKAYVGLGQYKETVNWSNSYGVSVESDEFSGFLFTLGLGLNIGPIALDASMSARDMTEYEDARGTAAESITAVSTAIIASVRF